MSARGVVRIRRASKWPTQASAVAAPTFMATVLRGLEPVLADEIRAKVADVDVVDVLRGKVLFRCSGEAELAILLALRTADDVFALLARFPQGRHRAHLADLERTAARVHAGGAPTLLDHLAANPTVHVNASRSGQQTYSRFEAAAAAQAGLLRGHPHWRAGTTTQHDLELRLDILGEEALLSLRLSPPGFRYRGAARDFYPAALRPTVAHALVWLTRPAARDVVVDPFCGSGTIVGERVHYPAARVLGGDMSTEALATAERNLVEGPATQELVPQLFNWDARHLPLRYGAVDAIATNLPFGHQVLTESDVRALYPAFLEEAARVMAPGSRMIALTDQETPLLESARHAGLRAVSQASVSLKGLHPQVWRLEPIR